MKFGTIRQASFIFLCFSSLVSILIIQYFNLWILLNSTTTTKTTTTLNKTGREKVKVDNSNNNNNKLLYDKVVENSAEEDRIHEQKKSKSKLKREFSIKEIDEFSEKSELMKRMLTNETSSQLLNLSNLTFLIEPNQSVDCRSIDYSNNYQQEGLKLIIVVNSKWSNFERRRRVRDGWLNVDKINEQICQYQLNSLNHSGGELKKKWRLKKSGKLLFIRRVEYLFALGKPSPADEVNKLSSQRAELRHKLRNRAMKHDHEAADTAAHDDDANRLMMMIDAPVLNESNEFKDLLVINLHEEYRSMSIKHLSIFKWLLKSHYNNIQQHQSSQSSRNIKQQDKTSTGSMYDQIKKQLSYYEKRGQFKVVDEALNSTLVLKCDDDADINLAQLIEFYYQDRMNFVEKLSPLNELFIDDYELSSLTGDDDGSDNDNDKQISDNNVDSSSSSFIEKHDDDDDDQEDRKTATKVQRDLNWWIMCAKFPQDTKVYRHSSGSGQNKWQITRSEYHFDTYPAYCSGLAYLAPLSLLKRLFVLSHILLWDENSKNYSEPFWVDDVFITGILFSSLIESERARIVRLNAHFCYTRAHQSRRLQLNAPCMVSEVQ